MKAVYIFVAVGLLLIAACSKKNCTPKKTDIYFCSQENTTVCGCDGNTYGNACEAAKVGIDVEHLGDCN